MHANAYANAIVPQPLLTDIFVIEIAIDYVSIVHFVFCAVKKQCFVMRTLTVRIICYILFTPKKGVNRLMDEIEVMLERHEQRNSLHSGKM